MPVVPTRNSFSTTPQTGFTARANSSVISADAAAVAGRQTAALGQGMQSLSNDLIKVELDAQKEANQLRVASALNQARQSALDAAYDPQQGYLNLKGLDALSRPEGRSLVDEFGSRYDTSLADIENSLGNDEQKRNFRLQAAQLSTGFRADLQQHTLREYTNYNTSVADGTIKLAQQEAALFYNDPTKVDAAIHGILDPETGERSGGLRQAIYNKAKLQGTSANEVEAAMNESESGVHSSVIMSALTNNDATYATAYFERSKKNMVAADILKVQEQINSTLDANVAMEGVKAATRQLGPAFQPGGMDRLVNLVKTQESGNREYNADGTRVTSPKGARGIMQLMPETAKNPGFNLKPSDGTPEDDERLATQYLDVMVKRYGDVRQALAAYNAGPGTVDKALKDSERDGRPSEWLSYLPAETRNYVPAIADKFVNGAGRPPLPSKLDFVNAAVADIGENPRPEAVTLTRTSAEKQYELLNSARETQSNNALEAAQQELLANGGDLVNLSPGTRMALLQTDPENYKKASEFARAVANPVATNLEAYATAALNPQELAAMPEAAFIQYLKTNFDAGDQAKVIEWRKDAMTGTSQDSPQSLNTAALNTALEGRLESIGVNSSPRSNDTRGKTKVGEIQRYVRNKLYDSQRELGRKLSPEEIEQHINVLFTKDGVFKDTVWGVKDKNLPELTVEMIPASDYSAIVRNMASRGVTNPSEDAILRTFRTWRKLDAPAS